MDGCVLSFPEHSSKLINSDRKLNSSSRGKGEVGEVGGLQRSMRKLLGMMDGCITLTVVVCYGCAHRLELTK